MRKNNFNPIIVISTILLFVGASLAYYWVNNDAKPSNKFSREYAHLIGTKFPSDKADTVINGESTVRIPAGGRNLIILGSTGCDACKRELEFIKQSNLPGIQNVYFISAEPLGQITRKSSGLEGLDKKVGYVSDKGNRYFQKLKIRYLPTNLIVNDGVIQDVFVGAPRDISMFNEFLHGEMK